MSYALPSIPLPPLSRLEAVVHTFYDKVYAHPWIGRFFRHVDQEHQETKLVRFFQLSWEDQSFPEMQAQYLRQEHVHMYITTELFELRQQLFAEALREHGSDEREVEIFLKFNDLWRPSVVKESIDQCSSMFTAVVEHPRPDVG